MTRIVVCVCVMLALAGCSKKKTNIEIMPDVPIERPPVAVQPAPEPEPATTVDLARTVDPVREVTLFDFDSDRVRPEAALLLDAVLVRMAGRYGAVDLVGGACPIGDDRYNSELGLRRAYAVRDYLSEHRPDIEYRCSSVGETCLVATDRAQYRLNRRCEIYTK